MRSTASFVRPRTTLVAAAVASVFTVAAGCYVRPEPVVVGTQVSTSPDYGAAYAYPTVPPPAPIVEYRPPPPGYGYAWVDGYWDWTGYDWAWSTGNWVPERPGYIYVRPRYVYQGDRWVYQRSYWGAPDGRRDYDWGRPAGRAGRPSAVGVAPSRGGEPQGRPPAVWAPPVRGAAPGNAPPGQVSNPGWGRPAGGSGPGQISAPLQPLPQRGAESGPWTAGAPGRAPAPGPGGTSPGWNPPARGLPPGQINPAQPRYEGAAVPQRTVEPGAWGGRQIRPIPPSRPANVPSGMGPGGGGNVPQAQGTAPNRMGPGSSSPARPGGPAPSTSSSRPAQQPQPIKRSRPPGM